MVKFKDTIITDLGRKLLLKIGAGEGEIAYTKAVLFGQSVTNMQDDEVRKLTQLQDKKMETHVAVTPPKDNTLTVSASFVNSALTQDITFNSVGWFAKNNEDNVEILLGISPSIDPQTLAAGSPDHRSTASIDIELAMAISDAAKVDLTVNEIGIAYISDVNAAIEKLKTEYDPKIAEAGKVKGATINGGNSVAPDEKGILNLVVDSERIIKVDPAQPQNNVDNLINSGTYEFNPGYQSERPILLKVFNDGDNIYQVEFSNLTENYGTLDTLDFRMRYRVRLQGNWTNWKEVNTSNLSENYVNNLIQSKLDGLSSTYATKSAVAITKPYPIGVNDLNNLPEGRYNTRNLTENQWQAIKNIPPIDHFGMIICYREDGDGWQLAFSTSDHDAIYYRGTGGGIYSGWQRLAYVNTDDILKKIASANDNANIRLPLSGGNMDLRSIIQWTGGGIRDNTGNLGGLVWIGGSDNARIYGDQNGNDNLDLAFDLGDDGSNHFSFRKNGAETSAITSDGHFTGTIDWDHINNKPNVAVQGDLQNYTFNDNVVATNREVDCNDYLYKTGIFKFVNVTFKNGPVAGNKWGWIQTLRYDGNSIIQFYIDSGGQIWWRQTNDRGLRGAIWQRLVDTRDTSELQNQINQLKNNHYDTTDLNAGINWSKNNPNGTAYIY